MYRPFRATTLITAALSCLADVEQQKSLIISKMGEAIGR